MQRHLQRLGNGDEHIQPHRGPALLNALHRELGNIRLVGQPLLREAALLPKLPQPQTKSKQDECGSE